MLTYMHDWTDLINSEISLWRRDTHFNLKSIEIKVLFP